MLDIALDMSIIRFLLNAESIQYCAQPDTEAGYHLRGSGKVACSYGIRMSYRDCGKDPRPVLCHCTVLAVQRPMVEA